MLRRSLVVASILPCLTLAGTPWPAAGSSRLEGRVVGMDGRAVRGYTLHLIDGGGRDVRQATTAGDGLYTFAEIADGSYALAVENPDGLVAVVDAPPVRLTGRALARRDVRLAQADPSRLDSAIAANPSVGLWWAGLSPASKAWTIVGVAFLAILTFSAIDDNPREPDASPTLP